MPRARKDPGAEPKPKAPPKSDPLEGLDYSVEKREGKWVAECLGVTAYGATKKAALSMLSNELNGFKEEPTLGQDQPMSTQPSVTVTVSPAQVVALTISKGESYSLEDAELLWGIEYPSKPELLRQLFQERISLKTDADRIKERIDAINKSLLGFYERQGVESVKWEDWTVAKVNGSNSTLDKEALVLAGVPAETIAKCTKRKEYTTVRVTGPKGGE